MDVLLVALNEGTGEMQALIESAGYRLVREFVQRRSRPDSRFFVGKGKLRELGEAVRESHADAVVFAGSLRPSQHYQLERALKVPCYDRLRVILEIFTQRAGSREAKLQVELAVLQYEVPILREWIHKATAGERPGFMAGGEYRVDTYYETVRRRMKRARDGLEAVRKERAVRRGHRERRGFYHVSVAGYANAGKSSLFNALSGEQVLVDDRLFTTLSTTTRALEHVKRRILLTDTVGLVSDVPLWLVEAFHSTFEEVYASDLIVLLVDASDPIEDVRQKVELAGNTLLSGIGSSHIIPVLAKVDLVTPEVAERCVGIVRGSDFVRPPLSVSARTGVGLDALRDAIVEEFRYPVELAIRVPRDGDGAAFLSWLHDETDVVSVFHRTDGIDIRLRCRDRDVGRIRARATVTSGPVLT